MSCDGGDNVTCDGGDGMSCEGGGAKRDGASLIREASSNGANSSNGAIITGVGGAVKHQPVTFNPHGGSVLSLKVSVCAYVVHETFIWSANPKPKG